VIGFPRPGQAPHREAGMWVRSRRIECSMPQRHLAECLDVTQVEMSQMERGRAKMTPRQARCAARALDADPRELLEILRLGRLEHRGHAIWPRGVLHPDFRNRWVSYDWLTELEIEDADRLRDSSEIGATAWVPWPDQFWPTEDYPRPESGCV